MTRWILACTLLSILACNPHKGPGFVVGTDDTGADDTDGPPVDDCPPTLGAIEAIESDYPGTGWVAEISVPFTEGTCPIDTGLLKMEWGDGSGATQTEGPWTIGFDNQDIFVETYDDQTHAGRMFFAFTLPERGYHIEFEVWVNFPDGSSSDRASGSLN